MNDSHPPPLSSRVQEELLKLFRRNFGFTPPHWVAAPGRVEILGNHTDYNQGLVLCGAINQFLSMAASPRSDGRVRLVSSAFPSVVEFRVTNLQRDEQNGWTNYIKGVLAEFQRRGVPVPGFDAAVHSEIPPGAGLSSSAALAVATVLVFRRMFPFRVTSAGHIETISLGRHGRLPELKIPERLHLARLCRQAENRYAGVQCGLLDFAATLCGRAGEVMELDCQDETVSWHPWHPDLALVILPCGVQHRLDDGIYNQRRMECHWAAQRLHLPSLRRLLPEDLDRYAQLLPPTILRRARHVVTENRRVSVGVRLLDAGEWEDFGTLLYQSHESSRENFENSCPELDRLVELAGNRPECAGARLTGGGFGGSTINLVWRQQVDSFLSALRQAVRDPILCHPVNGAGG